MSVVPNSINQINELMQGLQVGSNVQFDMGDDSFANLLNSKIEQFAGNNGETYTQLMGAIGVPVGLQIEGLTDDPFKVSAINSSELGELGLNQSEVSGHDDEVIKSSGNRIDKEIFEQLGAKRGGTTNISVIDLFQMASSKNTIKASQAQENSTGMGNFMKKHAANLYGTLGKVAANNLSDILSAI